MGSVHTITTDNGGEFAEHKYISERLHTTTFFAHPYSSWEKGAIESYDRLLRQFIPKQTDFKTLTNKQIMIFQKQINERPREKLNFATPQKEFFDHFI